ncbi:hypothetical protein [uncultured Gammaproteobacteria bacterium]|nr:hypothetical protein [uncultured Gammaproteobacteria bacterium]
MYSIKFDPQTIEHLGVKMYSTLPPVLAELISNAYDADAEKVSIEFQNDPKSIVITDDGNGMSYDELNNSYLVIGRDRRKNNDDVSPKKTRKVTGRKGLGKLAMFGIAQTLKIESIQNHLKNGFIIDYQSMINSPSGEYRPKDLFNENTQCSDDNGTKITLIGIQRSSNFNIDCIAKSLASRLNFFDKNDFEINLSLDSEITCINKEYKTNNLETEFKWELDDDIFSDIRSFVNDHTITGYLASTETPISGNKDLLGVALFARGKLVNNRSFYEIQTSSSHAYGYITGEIHINYIDDNDDYISTARDSLIWSNNDLKPLSDFLQRLIRAVASDWIIKRQKKVKDKVNEHMSISMDDWLDSLPSHDEKLANKILSNIIKSQGLPPQRAANLIEYVQGAFEFQSFKDFASDLSETDLDSAKVLELAREWEIVEAKELYRVCLGRIETIQKLEVYINSDVLEVGKDKSMHEFLKKFPWLLEPRANQFQDEARFSDLLKNHEAFKEDRLDEQDRRIDFLCTGFGDTLYVIEIKRSQHSISKKDIRQLEDYYDFVKANLGDSYKNVSGFIVGKKLANSNEAREQKERAEKSRLYVKEYNDLLVQAKRYHQDFIDRYDEFSKIKKDS